MWVRFLYTLLSSGNRICFRMYNLKTRNGFIRAMVLTCCVEKHNVWIGFESATSTSKSISLDKIQSEEQTCNTITTTKTTKNKSILFSKTDDMPKTYINTKHRQNEVKICYRKWKSNLKSLVFGMPQTKEFSCSVSCCDAIFANAQTQLILYDRSAHSFLHPRHRATKHIVSISSWFMKLQLVSHLCSIRFFMSGAIH